MSELDHKEGWALKNWCFLQWYWRMLLRVPWIARRSNQSILKEIDSEYSLEGLMLKLKLQVLWSSDAKNWLTRKDPDARKGWGKEEKGMTEDEIVGWHHQLDGHEFEQAPGVGDGQGSLMCCSPWDSQESFPTPQFQSINSSVLSFHYSPNLTSIHDHWKSHCLN